MTGDVLTERELSRATLARQHLLERVGRPVLDMVRHLVGMQAQVPHDPYLALWSRLDAFDPDELSRLLLDREVVRIGVMRGTLHLVTADDALTLRPLVQAVFDAQLARHGEHGAALRGVDLEPVLAVGRPFYEEQPRTGAQVRALLAERFPKHDAAALTDACRFKLALVQVPPRGLWGRGGQVMSTTAEAWLGRPLVRHPSIDDVAMRYFAAFGPASVADVATWSRLTGLREVVDRLRDRLRRFRDERGREVFDVPDAPRPPADTPAPVRFLPEYDNVLLSHSDRTRFVSDDERRALFAGERKVRGSVLVDGRAVGTWRDDNGVLTVDHAVKLSRVVRDQIAVEGQRMIRFLAPDADDAEVRFAALA